MQKECPSPGLKILPDPSSTEAYWQNFADGTVGHGPKSDLLAVCPIMMF